jgi:hypothetical protein
MAHIRGTVFHNPEFRFHDGEIGNKLLVLLNTPAQGQSFRPDRFKTDGSDNRLPIKTSFRRYIFDARKLVEATNRNLENPTGRPVQQEQIKIPFYPVIFHLSYHISSPTIILHIINSL